MNPILPPVIWSILATVMVASANAGPMVLEDSDNVPVEQSVFQVNCTPTADFAAKLKATKGKLAIFDSEQRDNSVVMVIKYDDGSMMIARTNKEATTTCVLATMMTPDVDIGTIIKEPEHKNMDMGKNKDFTP